VSHELSTLGHSHSHHRASTVRSPLVRFVEPSVSRRGSLVLSVGSLVSSVRSLASSVGSLVPSVGTSTVESSSLGRDDQIEDLLIMVLNQSFRGLR